jgi:transmembrane sensor
MKAKTGTSAASVKWEEQPLEWPRAAGQVDLLMAALEVRKKRRRRRRAAAGAAAVLTGTCLWFFTATRVPVGSAASAPGSRSIVVAPERRILADGSVVELRPGAELTVNFAAASNGPRSVALSKGEAHFQVAKDPGRPFVVSAAGVNFRAVGTAFSVGVGGAAVEMLVTEGRVAVETLTETAAAPKSVTLVDAGNRVVVETATPKSPEISAVSVAATQEKLAWRVPRLEFNETPLAEVVSLLNLHSGSRISLASASLGRVEISGALRADNLEPLLQILETTYRIEVVRRPGGEIVLKLGR